MDSVHEFKIKRLTVATSTLTDRVSEALIQLINGEELPPGSRLSVYNLRDVIYCKAARRRQGAVRGVYIVCAGYS